MSEDDLDLDALAADLRDAIEDIPHGDPDSVTIYKDGSGHFIINAELNDFDDYDAIDDPIREAGFEPDGVVQAPGMTQQNVTLPGGDEDEEEA